MNKAKFAFVPALAFLTLPGFGMDISGRVVDKRFAPIEAAEVCLSGKTGCVTSDANGNFHLVGTSTVRPGEHLAKGYSLDFVRGAFTLIAPEAGPARVEWFSEGSRVGLASDVDLSKGRNELTAPDHDGHGLLLLRVSTDRFSVTWKTILEGQGQGVSGSEGAAFVALSKTAAPTSLEVSKTGFAATSYLPKTDTETGDIIVMGGEGETVSLLFDGKTLQGWAPFSKTGPAPNTWDVQDSALHCKGTARGTLNTEKDYGDFRIIFSVKHISTGKDHQPCVLIFCYRTPFYDAAGGVQFQVPNGGHWDYRPGKNTGNPDNEFSTPAGAAKLDNKVWNQCEIIAHKATGIARMACCTLTGNGPCKGKENLDFKNAAAGRDGPFALQAHNDMLLDEYKNISIEVNPKVDDLITTK